MEKLRLFKTASKNAILFFLVLFFSQTTFAQPEVTPTVGKLYQILNKVKENGQEKVIWENSTTNALVMQNPVSADFAQNKSQIWALMPSSEDGVYYLRNAATGRYIMANETNSVGLYSTDDTVANSALTKYRLVVRLETYWALEFTEGVGLNSSTNLVTYASLDNNNRSHWTFIEVPDSLLSYSDVEDYWNKPQSYYDLEQAINAAEALGTLTAGDEVGCYDEFQIENFENTLLDAYDIFNNPESTEDDYISVKNGLETVMAELEVIMPDPDKYYVLRSAFPDEAYTGQYVSTNFVETYVAAGSATQTFLYRSENGDNNSIWKFSPYNEEEKLYNLSNVASGGYYFRPAQPLHTSVEPVNAAGESMGNTNAAVLPVGSKQFIIKSDNNYSIALSDNFSTTNNKGIEGLLYPGIAYSGSRAAWTIEEAVINRSIGSAGFAILYLPYQVELPEGVKAYYVSSISSSTSKVILTEITAIIPALTPVLVQAEEGDYSFAYIPGNTEEIVENKLTGTSKATYVTGDNCYVVALSGGKAVLSKADLTFDAEGAEGTTHFLSQQQSGYLYDASLSGVDEFQLQVGEAPEHPQAYFDLQEAIALAQTHIDYVGGTDVGCCPEEQVTRYENAKANASLVLATDISTESDYVNAKTELEESYAALSVILPSPDKYYVFRSASSVEELSNSYLSTRIAEEFVPAGTQLPYFLNRTSYAENNAVWSIKEGSQEGKYNLHNVASNGIYFRPAQPLHNDTLPSTGGQAIIDLVQVGDAQFVLKSDNSYCIQANNIFSYNYKGVAGVLFSSLLTKNSDAAWRIKEASIEVTIGETEWTSLYSALQVTLPANVKAYYVSAIGTGLVTLSQIEGTIPANTAVVLNGPAGSYTFEYEPEATDSVAENKLQGTLVNTLMKGTEQKYYALSKPADGEIGLYPVQLTYDSLYNEGTEYFVNQAGTVYMIDENNSQSDFFLFDDGTSIFTLKMNGAADKKAIFDITGRRIERITNKGLYIINGKKYIVK